VTHLAGGVPAGAWGSVPQAGPDPGRPGSARCDAVPVPGGVPGGTGYIVPVRRGPQASARPGRDPLGTPCASGYICQDGTGGPTWAAGRMRPLSSSRNHRTRRVPAASPHSTRAAPLPHRAGPGAGRV